MRKMSHKLETLTGMYYYFCVLYSAHVDALRQCQQQQKVYSEIDQIQEKRQVDVD